MCTDDDECMDGTHVCAANATCINTDGGYNCSCDSGYDGDGFECSSMFPEHYMFLIAMNIHLKTWILHFKHKTWLISF